MKDNRRKGLEWGKQVIQGRGRERKEWEVGEKEDNEDLRTVK